MRAAFEFIMAIGFSFAFGFSQQKAKTSGAAPPAASKKRNVILVMRAR